MKELNFKADDDTIVGRFTDDMAREILEKQFGEFFLTPEAKNFLAHEIGSGESIGGNKFNDIVNEARERGYITAEKAEKIKDEAKLPDNMNEHWK